MASAAARVSLSDVREQVKRMQNEGERLVERIRRDAKGLLSSTRQEVVSNLLKDARQLQADVRKRIDAAVKDFDARREKLRAAIEEQATRAVEATVQRLRVASANDLTALRGRIEALEKQINVLSRELSALHKEKSKAERAA